MTHNVNIKLYFISVEIHSTLTYLITTEEIIALYKITYSWTKSVTTNIKTTLIQVSSTRDFIIMLSWHVYENTYWWKWKSCLHRVSICFLLYIFHLYLHWHLLSKRIKMSMAGGNHNVRDNTWQSSLSTVMFIWQSEFHLQFFKDLYKI